MFSSLICFIIKNQEHQTSSVQALNPSSINTSLSIPKERSKFILDGCFSSEEEDAKHLKKGIYNLLYIYHCISILRQQIVDINGIYIHILYHILDSVLSTAIPKWMMMRKTVPQICVIKRPPNALDEIDSTSDVEILTPYVRKLIPQTFSSSDDDIVLIPRTKRDCGLNGNAVVSRIGSSTSNCQSYGTAVFNCNPSHSNTLPHSMNTIGVIKQNRKSPIGLLQKNNSSSSNTLSISKPNKKYPIGFTVHSKSST